MAIGGSVLGSAAFLVAVSGLLAPPLYLQPGFAPFRPRTSTRPPRITRSDPQRGPYFATPMTSKARRRGRCLRVGNEISGEGAKEAGAAGEHNAGNGNGSFNASAWKRVISSAPATTASPTGSEYTAVLTSSKGATTARGDILTRESEGEGGEQEGDISVDVEKLPTFVFFVGEDGRYRREDVVGGGDARACAAELQEKLVFLLSQGSTRPASPVDNNSRLPLSGARGERTEATVAENIIGSSAVGGGSSDGGDCLDEVGDTGIGSGSGGTDVDVPVDVTSSSTNAIVEISSKDDLLRVLDTRRKERGPVVVMYHAPWCRKCAYLTPVFRRLSAIKVTSVSCEEAGGRSSTDGPLFCRADVSHPSWGRRPASRSATAASFRAAAEGTAAGATTTKAAAPIVAGGGEQNEAAVTVDASQARQHGASARAAGLTVTDDTGAGAGADAGAAGAGAAEAEEEAVGLLHTGSHALENCDVCEGSGFVPCGECNGRGAVSRSSPDGKHTMAVTCPSCVGYKRLRCPSCGGKCYMCD